VAGRRVTVFGGSGFLGCRIALRLAADGPEVRIAVLDL
jgi:nucleoside-diphosphate-sugar epimerase